MTEDVESIRERLRTLLLTLRRIVSEYDPDLCEFLGKLYKPRSVFLSDDGRPELVDKGDGYFLADKMSLNEVIRSGLVEDDTLSARRDAETALSCLREGLCDIVCHDEWGNSFTLLRVEWPGDLAETEQAVRELDKLLKCSTPNSRLGWVNFCKTKGPRLNQIHDRLAGNRREDDGEATTKLLTEAPRTETTDKPRWDNDTHQLFYGDMRVRKIRPIAKEPIKVLKAFQEEGWPRRIDSPCDPHANLSKVVQTLNKDLSVIKFEMDGTGEGLLWNEIAD